jgi:hypothetical protein
VIEWIVVVLIVGGAGFVASMYQIFGGPPWPTDPIFSAESPSAASPFENPFDVHNPSGWFAVRNLFIRCDVLSLKTPLIEVGRGGILDAAPRGLNPILKAGKTAVFTCPLREAMQARKLEGGLDKPSRATLAFISEFDRPWWAREFGRRETTSIFTLNTRTDPPRWEAGIPLK